MKQYFQVVDEAVITNRRSQVEMGFGWDLNYWPKPTGSTSIGVRISGLGLEVVTSLIKPLSYILSNQKAYTQFKLETLFKIGTKKIFELK